MNTLDAVHAADGDDDGSATGDGPRVVAIGGGHGLAVALAAVREYAGTITAVVTVADDGGSSGRLRRELGVPAPGDARRCLVALARDDTVWVDALEHRFRSGALEGHALGNLVIVGLAELSDDFAGALDEAGRLVGAVGRVLPATSEPVEIKADVDGRTVEGQVAISTAEGRIAGISLVPPDAPAHPEASMAIAEADQVVLAPGSLFTSILPVLCVDGLRGALGDGDARVVQVANLRTQVPETSGLDGADHLRAVLDHGVGVDDFLYDPDASLAVDPAVVESLGAVPVAAPVGGPVGRDGYRAHDPGQLAQALAALL